jgi:hypothetical protein
MQRTDDWTILERFEEASISRPQKLAPEDAVEFLSTLSIEVDGTRVTPLVKLNVPSHEESALEIVFREATDRWRQGLHLETDGSLEIVGSRASKFVLWQDTAPETVVVKCHSNSGKLRVWNVWDTGKGSVDSLINCSGIITESIGNNQWRLRCNDGYPDRDFRDLIVDVQIKDERRVDILR